MKQKKISGIGVCSGLVCILLLLSFFSGCVQNSATAGNSSVSQPTISPQAVTSSPEIQRDNVNSRPVNRNTPQINVTIHSAFKTLNILGSTPKIGNIFVVVNMTIENLGNMAYQFNENTVGITGGGPITQKLYTQLRNPIHWGSIPPHEKITGEVVFGVNTSTQQFTVTFLNNNNKVILTHEISNIPVVKDYSPSILPAGLLENKDFAYVVKNLDTPEKAAQYAKAKFTFKYHDGCISYPPDEFFQGINGDCKDYATFLSYVIAQHGNDAKIIAFSYYKEGVRNGHVVTLFTDTDGKMKYATTPDVTIFREVTSVDDLLAKECLRLGVPSIANSRVVAAGSLDSCVK